MSKHSLISTVAGLGLMAASMGVSAQSSLTFDYSMMFYGNATGGGKYVAFVPTSLRAGDGAAAVLMLDLFVPASGTASTWAFAIGGPVSDVVNSAATVDAGATFGKVGLGALVDSTDVLALAFTQNPVLSSQICNVTFNAEIDSNNQLRFKDINARVGNADGHYLIAKADVHITTGAAPGAGLTIASTAWNAGASTLAAIAGAASSIASNQLVWVTGANTANDTVAVNGAAAANAQIAARNKCVPAYTARAQGGATVINPGGGTTMLGMTRVW